MVGEVAFRTAVRMQRIFEGICCYGPSSAAMLARQLRLPSLFSWRTQQDVPSHWVSELNLIIQALKKLIRDCQSCYRREHARRCHEGASTSHSNSSACRRTTGSRKHYKPTNILKSIGVGPMSSLSLWYRSLAALN